MKKKILMTAINIIILILSFSSANSQSNPAFQNKFTLGAFNYYPFSPDSFYSNPTQIDYYKELSFNFLEGHSGDHQRYSTTELGAYSVPISTYKQNIEDMLAAWITEFGNEATILYNDRIGLPCYGQMSTYQAEERGTWNTKSPGYGYMYIGRGNDTTETWQGQTVKSVVARQNRDAQGYLEKDLYENKEQMNWIWNGWGYPNDIMKFPHINDSTMWYIKPKMRMDSVFAKANPDTLVAAIVIRDYHGNIVDSVLIKCRQFLTLKSGVLYYNGSYKEMYDFPNASRYPLMVNGKQLNPDTLEDVTNSKVDYRVYWFGKCDIWLDYVKVADEWAHLLFNPELDFNHKFDFYDKIVEATEELTSIDGYAYFYVDEFEYNMIPAIAEVNRIIKSVNAQSGVIVLLSQTPYGFWMRDALRRPATYPECMSYAKSSGAIQDIFFSEPYPFEDKIPLPPNITLPNTTTNPRTNNYYKATTNNIYNDSMNNFIERRYMSNFRDVSQAVKNTDIIFSLCTQVHSFEELWESDPNSPTYSVWREPLSEEIRMQNYLGLAYGAKQLIYFIHQSFYNWSSSSIHNYGLLEFPTGSATKRMNNYYGLPKWNTVASDDSTLLEIGQYIVDQNKLKWDTARTAYFQPRPYEYIDSIKSYYRYSETTDGGETFDALDAKNYWEVGFFDANSTVEPNHTYIKHFMAVNKRCTPETSVGAGDLRKLELKFNSSGLSDFVNWKLINAMTNEVLGTFNKNSSGFIDAGIFQPGEGKLFKLIPVMIDGGTLVADESLTDISFNCNAPVYTNGNDITLNHGVNIDFAPDARIIAHRGTFTAGTGVTSTLCTFEAQNTALGWAGLQFDSTDVNINYTKIRDVRKKADNHNTALYMFNSPEINITHSSIHPLNSVDSSTSGVVAFYGSGLPFTPSLNMEYDTIKVTNYYYGIDVEGYSERSGDFNFSNNYIKNEIGAGVGFLFVNLIDPILHYNVVLNWYQSVYAYNTSVDLWANYIYSSPNYRLLFGENESFFDMSSDAGGFNTFWGNAGKCVTVDDSYFYARNGGNCFDLQNTSTGYFFYGKFSSGAGASQDARENCFTTNYWVQITDSALIHSRMNVKLSDNTTPVGFRLLDYFCTGLPEKLNASKKELSSDKRNSDLRNPAETKVNNIKGNNVKQDNEEDKTALSENLYSEMKAALKKDDYILAKQKCTSILELGLEDMFSVNAVRQLFHCVALQQDKNSNPTKQTKQTISSEVKKDLKARDSKQSMQSGTTTDKTKTTIQNGSFANTVSDLKSYYESYIQSHSANRHIISAMFYYIQKCKIILGDYTSALQGYKAIMEQNPSSIKGLNAKWEYMMLSQFIPKEKKELSGKGGGESQLTINNEQLIINNEQLIINNEQLTDEQKHERLAALVEDQNEGPKDGKDKYNTKKFTKEDRKVITNNIINSLKENDRKDKANLKILEEKVNNNLADANEIVEYRKRSLFKELIKIENAGNANEVVSIIQNDLRKILELDGKPSDVIFSKTTPVLAYDYKLNQNYPNPFNPSTKINYEIKNAGFVSLKIYDLLGREIAELVNTHQDAGRYSVDFNTSKYMMASGIYFYRIKAGEFIDTKRMVLVK